jgi:L-alanine-DL-glutamate epimerase-like enolase superfamily enzyme
MRIRDIAVIHARIPLKKRIRHASHERSENDTVLVRCRLADGTTGWGEGLPREYVTGETIGTAFEQFARKSRRNRTGHGRQACFGSQLTGRITAQENFQLPDHPFQLRLAFGP